MPEYPGCEMWWYGGKIMTSDGQQIQTDGGSPIGYSSCNMSIWFTGSINRQLLDGNKVSTNNASDGKERRPLRANFFNAKAINGTKENPCLYADLLGDWREEIVYTDSAETCLKIFSTWYPTEYRFPCLLQDHHYEMSALNQQIGYNQPTETGFYLGSDMLQTVEFREVNGLKPTITIFRDSLQNSKVDNGQLIAGRTYYARYLNYTGGVYRGSFPFTFQRHNPVVEIDVKNGGVTAVSSITDSTHSNADKHTYNLGGITSKRAHIIITNGKKIIRSK